MRLTPHLVVEGGGGTYRNLGSGGHNDGAVGRGPYTRSWAPECLGLEARLAPTYCRGRIIEKK